jgi:hypothetical protein
VTWEPGALALCEAARRRATYVVVATDPLAGVASAWRAMWDVTSGPGSAAGFEEQAADALAAWRGKRFRAGRVDQLVERRHSFHAGGLAEMQQARYS